MAFRNENFNVLSNMSKMLLKRNIFTGKQTQICGHIEFSCFEAESCGTNKNKLLSVTVRIFDIFYP